jgi:hypothetical protein
MITVAWHVAVGVLAAIGAMSVVRSAFRARARYRLNLRIIAGDPEIDAAVRDASALRARRPANPKEN